MTDPVLGAHSGMKKQARKGFRTIRARRYLVVYSNYTHDISYIGK